MGVYIKDMEMPKKCGTCDFRVNDFTCLALSGAVLKVLYKRPDWCPLIEIKVPHGDLIDRGELIADLHDTYLYEDMARKVIYRKVEEQKTVIEAEGMEE